MKLDSLLAKAESMPKYPVHTWHPKQQGSIDIKIKSTGEWIHEGSEITRIAIKQLFSRLLVFRQGDYWLVTPAEQLKITVESWPFVIIQADYIESVWNFTTNVGDQLLLKEPDQWYCQLPSYQLTKEPERPRVRVRDNLWAHFSRQAYYQMALSVKPSRKKPELGCITSNQHVFIFGCL